MESLIRVPDDSTLELAGRRLDAAGKAPAWKERLLEAMARRFYERRPNAGERTWHEFEVQLAAVAREWEQPSEQMIQEIFTLIDSL
jgi:hypothetical protein